VARLAAAFAGATALIIISTAPSSATGPSWTVSAFAIDSGYLGVGESVSCPTPTGCVAVGRTGEEANSRAASAPSAAIEVAGTWGPFASVSDETGVEHGSLSSVSCWAAWQCVAVGLAWHGSPLVPHLIAYELDGSTWTALSPPTPRHTEPTIGAVSVSCVGSGTCRVMGFVSTSPRGATVRAFVTTFLAGSWTTTSFLVPPNTLDIGSITCSSTMSCASLLDTGIVGRASGVLRSYVDWMGATGWRRTMPLGWGNLDATQLTCPSPTTCVAAGDLRSGPSAVSQQALGWGTSDIVPGGAYATVVACPTTACEVIVNPYCNDSCGHGPSPSGGVFTLQDNSWTPTSMPTPQGLLNVEPVAMSCDVTQCTVTGFGEVWATGDAFNFLPFVATMNLGR
jgi:hypothetical protein